MKIIKTVGDVNPIEHGGGVVFKTEDGFMLEYTHGMAESELDTEREEQLVIYQVHYESETQVPDILDWVKWEDVLPCFGLDETPTGSEAIEVVGQYHGWFELDQYPETLTVEECEERWGL